MKTYQALILPIILIVAASLLFSQESTHRHITVLYTNDEHGWMEGMSENQGAAHLYELWREEEGYTVDGSFLILSGGDNWTGPAISTWVEGESMVEVMNAMQYDASAVGNHEFDFGLDALAERAGEANFPYLSANTRWKVNARVPEDLGILPYTIQEINGISIGIIGLTTRSTPFTTNPVNVRDLAFINYETAVRETMPAIAGTDLQFIVAHVCMEEMERLLPKIQDLGIDLAGGGHCNELTADKIGETILLGGGFHFTAYVRASFEIDPQSGSILASSFSTHRNRGADPDPFVAGIVESWSQESADVLNEVMAWSETRVPQGPLLDQAIIDSWLAFYPNADIAITNRGGIRSALPQGEITFSDIVSIMPFDNTIIVAGVPGRVIAQALEGGGRPVVAGIARSNGRWVFTQSGQPMLPEEEYTLLLNSFMYAGGDNFGVIAEADSDAFDTGVNYRQPFVEWLRNSNSTESDPMTLE